MASQLRAATAASSASVQAGAAAASMAGALKGGAKSAKGLLKGLRPGSEASAPAIPSDGTRCEECGEYFGMMNRRFTCGSCDRFLCGPCLGRNAFASMTGIACFCGSMCPRCREQNQQTGEFEGCRPAMESGVSVSLTLPKKAPRGLFGGGQIEMKKMAVWLALEADGSGLKWATLEQKSGRPADEGQILLYEILYVRDTGSVLELPMKGSEALTLEFATSTDRQDWARYLDLAVQVLTPESERASLDAARNSLRLKELEERRVRNEERKKELSKGLGMKYTAQAMIAREEKAAAEAKQSGNSKR